MIILLLTLAALGGWAIGVVMARRHYFRQGELRGVSRAATEMLAILRDEQARRSAEE